jgi:hypothetical protein
MKKTTQRHDGQAIVEYMFLSVIAMLIFGAVFLTVRIQIYRLWVCDLMPRIQGPTGCSPGSSCIEQVYGRSYASMRGAVRLDENVSGLVKDPKKCPEKYMSP